MNSFLVKKTRIKILLVQPTQQMNKYEDIQPATFAQFMPQILNVYLLTIKCSTNGSLAFTINVLGWKLIYCIVKDTCTLRMRLKQWLQILKKIDIVTNVRVFLQKFRSVFLF